MNILDGLLAIRSRHRGCNVWLMGVFSFFSFVSTPVWLYLDFGSSSRIIWPRHVESCFSEKYAFLRWNIFYGDTYIIWQLWSQAGPILGAAYGLRHSSQVMRELTQLSSKFKRTDFWTSMRRPSDDYDRTPPCRSSRSFMSGSESF